MWRRLAASPHTSRYSATSVQLVERHVAGGRAVRRLADLLRPQPVVGDQLARGARRAPPRVARADDGVGEEHGEVLGLAAPTRPGSRTARQRVEDVAERSVRRAQLRRQPRAPPEVEERRARSAAPTGRSRRERTSAATASGRWASAACRSERAVRPRVRDSGRGGADVMWRMRSSTMSSVCCMLSDVSRAARRARAPARARRRPPGTAPTRRRAPRSRRAEPGVDRRHRRRVRRLGVDPSRPSASAAPPAPGRWCVSNADAISARLVYGRRR